MNAKSARERVIRAVERVMQAMEEGKDSSIDKAFMALGKALIAFIVITGGDPEKVLVDDSIDSAAGDCAPDGK